MYNDCNRFRHHAQAGVTIILHAIMIFVCSKRCTVFSKENLQKKRRVLRIQSRHRRQAYRASSNNSITSSMEDIMGLYSGVVTPPRISMFPDPYVPKPNFLTKIPPTIYKEAFKTEQTPDPDVNHDDSNKPTTAKRRLFPSQPQTGTTGNQQAGTNQSLVNASTNQAQHIATWLAGLEPLYDHEIDTDGSVSSIPEEEQYGFRLPSWLNDSGPKLVKGKRRISGVPLSEQEKLNISRDNHTIVRRWLQDCSIERSVGKGHVDLSHQAIVAQSSNNCTFSKTAEEVLEKLSPVEQYPLKRYIGELKGKEKEAITTARIYRDKWEEAITSHENAIATLRKKDLSMRTFWRKNIAEQCTRGGKILNLALHANKPPVE